MTPIERSLFANSSQFEFMNLKMGESFLICEPNGLVYECQGKSKQLGSLYDNTLNLEKIFHGRCMAFKGCATASSANRYIKNVMNLPGLA
jgi:sulfatase maturation enzyme AslB (radical SAM superfamily)